MTATWSRLPPAALEMKPLHGRCMNARPMVEVGVDTVGNETVTARMTGV